MYEALRELRGVYVLPDDVEVLGEHIARAMRLRSEDDALAIMSCQRCGHADACAVCEDDRCEAYLEARGRARVEKVKAREDKVPERMLP